ncbi:ATP-binding protein [Bradyrhizobium sp. LA2.1]|uniref:sensor histidine kinase n=1 Tax=Bradyrhizobium sp. LA2.1 TaxID=3156376 RepID=UPI003393AD3A
MFDDLSIKLIPRARLESAFRYEMVRSIDSLIAATIGDSIALRLNLAAINVQVACDPQELESAILNLAINARDAMPSGRTLTINTVAVLDEDCCPAAPAKSVEIQVKDSGEEMSPQTIKRACDAFYTTKADRHGSGLGLWSVKVFAEGLRGGVDIESVEGVGTTVRIRLPCVPEVCSL